MTLPTSRARAALDLYTAELVQRGDGLTLDDFRSGQIAAAVQTRRLVQRQIVRMSYVFIFLALATLAAQIVFVTLQQQQSGFLIQGTDMVSAAIWSLALGGLGAVSNIFLRFLKFMPEGTLRATDRFEVTGRILLGCFFSTVLSVTIIAGPMKAFFASIRKDLSIDNGVILLLPFIAGYSIPLVLGLIEKTIWAIELTIGLDDRRLIGGAERRPRPRPPTQKLPR
jgi:hypothetical protein